MMKTSRQKILEYFRLHHTASASELSRVMQMTPANARHHVNILVEEGALLPVGERLSGKQRGRPERIYRLAETLRENNLALLASLLLSAYTKGTEGKTTLSQWQDIASGLIERSGGTTSSHSLGPRLVQAVQVLNRLHYQARWEARPGAPEIILNHCPYREIIADHPELCKMDVFLLQALSGLQAEQTARLLSDHSGGFYCRFHLRSLR